MRTSSSSSLAAVQSNLLKLAAARDPFKLSSGSQVPSPALSSLSTLLKSPDALEVLNALKKSADDVKVSSLLRERKNFSLNAGTGDDTGRDGQDRRMELACSDWLPCLGIHEVSDVPCKFGPSSILNETSRRHVHLHVISSDLLSPKLKNKK